MDLNNTYSAFIGSRHLVTGTLEFALRKTKQFVESRPAGGRSDAGELLVFCDQTGKQADFDLGGTIEEVLRKASPPQVRAGPGRPRLGVVSREISLLPRHWKWLESQPNGASAALRRLVEDARKNESPETMVRARIDAVGRVMTALAGNLPGFEKACRALYRRDLARLTESMEGWPRDIRLCILEHAQLDPNDEGLDRPDLTRRINPMKLSN